MKHTPYVVINEGKLKRNIKNMSAMAKEENVNLRPHIKTHKMPYIAKMQLAEGAVGITVAKIAEAKVMVEHGIEDIFIAYPIVTSSTRNRHWASENGCIVRRSCFVCQRNCQDG